MRHFYDLYETLPCGQWPRPSPTKNTEITRRGCPPVAPRMVEQRMNDVYMLFDNVNVICDCHIHPHGSARILKSMESRQVEQLVQPLMVASPRVPRAYPGCPGLIPGYHGCFTPGLPRVPRTPGTSEPRVTKL